jgi:hypothetical protein
MGAAAAVAGIGAVASVAGGLMQRSAVNKAANQSNALQLEGRQDAVAALEQGRTDAVGALQGGQTDTIAAQRAALAQARTDLDPWRTQGANALTVASNLSGANGPEAAALAQQDFFTSPGYQFRLDEGMREVDAGAAAKGMLRSGATLKGEQRFAQGLASEEFGNYYQRLNDLSKIGLQSALPTANAEMQAGTNIGNAYLGTAGRLGDTYTGSAARIGNAYTGTAQDMANTEVSRGGAEASIYGNMAQGVGNAANSYIGNSLYNDRTNALLQQQQPLGAVGGRYSL